MSRQLVPASRRRTSGQVGRVGGLTFFETLDNVADERRAVDGHAKQRVGHDAGAQGRTRAGHAAPGAARAVIPAGGAALDELVQLGAAERGQAPDVGHVGVERAQRHAHLPQLDVHAAVGKVVRRRGQLAVLDQLKTQTWKRRYVGSGWDEAVPLDKGEGKPLKGMGMGVKCPAYVAATTVAVASV